MEKVLLVDDEKDIADALAELVQITFPDADVRTAKDAAEALTLLDGWIPSVIVSDYRMPGMNGLEFLAEAQKRHGAIPAILLTAFDQRDQAMQAARTGIVRRYYGKPPDIEAILGGIRELMHPENVA